MLLLVPVAPIGVVERGHAHNSLGGQPTAEEVVLTCGHGGARAVRRGGQRGKSSSKGGPVGMGA
jgi:hypothetical protein